MISFNIEAWRAVSQYCASTKDWENYFYHKQLSENKYIPALSFMKPSQKRRLKYSARLAVDAAWSFLEKHQKIPCIYASYDGEINRSFKLWLDLLSSKNVSPTSFGLSVHNAVIGQWSILRNDMSKNTAICAREDNFELAFIEAYLLLQEGNDKVLIMVCDDPLPDEYAIPHLNRAPFPYAFCCVISKGEQYQLSFSKNTDSTAGEGNYFGALFWLKAVLAQKNSFINTYHSRKWTWQVNY